MCEVWVNFFIIDSNCDDDDDNDNDDLYENYQAHKKKQWKYSLHQ